jgi:hypothetical protein
MSFPFQKTECVFDDGGWFFDGDPDPRSLLQVDLFKEIPERSKK